MLFCRKKRNRKSVLRFLFVVEFFISVGGGDGEGHFSFPVSLQHMIYGSVILSRGLFYIKNFLEPITSCVPCRPRPHLEKCHFNFFEVCEGERGLTVQMWCACKSREGIDK